MAAVELSRSNNNNLTRVYVGHRMTLWFSYETCVAFQAQGRRVVSQNVWSNTTGRHLSEIDGGGKTAKAERIPHGEFTERLEALMNRIGAAINEELEADE